MTIPVVFPAFNRPETALRSALRLARSRPSKVFIVIDGPRPDSLTDVGQVNATRNALQSFSWPCPVEFILREVNFGRRSIPEALDVIFREEERLFIVEDDVLIDENALEFGSGLLERFQHDPTVASVSLFSGVPKRFLTHPDSTYRYSAYFSTQFWGTYGDRWRLRKRTLNGWNEWLNPETLAKLLPSRETRYWRREFDERQVLDPPNWDYTWLASCWSNEWRTVITNTNHSLNIGFNENATNTTEAPSWFPSKLDEVPNLIIDPPDDRIDHRADAWVARECFGHTTSKQFKRWLDRKAPAIRPLYKSLRREKGSKLYVDGTDPS